MTDPVPKQSGKPIEWIGDSMERLTEFPLEVKKEIGYGLRQAQNGSKHSNAKPLHGNLSGVMEIAADHTSGTYRSVYLTNLGGTIYVLHCFKKKSKSGIATPQMDVRKIEARLKQARALHAQKIKEIGGNA